MSTPSHSSRRFISLFIIALVIASPFGLALAQSFQPQAGELLANPGFDAPYNQFYGLDVHVANGWTPWYITPGGATYPSSCPANAANCTPYQIPVYRNTQPQNAKEPARARSGDSQQWGTRYAVSVAGVYQRVTNITPGTRLSFSAYLQGFNCTDNSGCFSSSANYGKSYQPGDMKTRVGIDPTGGTDPFSSNIVWSSFQNPLDAFSLHQIEATAQGNAVTVFLWASPTAPELHTDVYADDASLVVAGQGPAPAATAGPTLPPGTQQPTLTPPSGPGTYAVQEGDTLFGIALQFNLTLDQLLALNPGVTRESILQVGQVLRVGTEAGTPLPTTQAAATSAAATPTTAAPTPGGPTTYTVQSGDTLSAIALQFNLTLDQLLALNPDITKDTPLNVGQVITVGVATATSTPEPTATLSVTESTPVPTPTPAVATSGLCLAAFDDANGSGTRDSGEALLPGVQFDVKDSSGTSVATYTSDGLNEPHCLNKLPDGLYTVEVTPPAGRVATTDSNWSLSLLSGSTVNVVFGAAAAPEATATPEAAPTAAAETANGGGGGVSIGLLVGGALILLAAVALGFGLRSRRQ
jgi:LysM repeat protein